MLEVLLEMLDTTERAWKNGHLTRREARMDVKWIDACIDAYELEQQIREL